MSPRHVVCLRLLSALAQDEHDLRQVEELVSSDPMLTVRTLRMANSAAAGTGRTISLVHQALVLVGDDGLSRRRVHFAETRTGVSAASGRLQYLNGRGGADRVARGQASSVKPPNSSAASVRLCTVQPCSTPNRVTVTR